LKVDKVTNETIFKLHISEIERLDVVNVYFDNIEKSKGRILVECWGRAWSSYWSAMGERTIEEFILMASNEYIIERLAPRKGPKSKDYKYLDRILNAIKDALKVIGT